MEACGLSSRRRGNRRPAPSCRRLASSGDGRRSSRPCVQPRLPSSACRAPCRVLGRGARWTRHVFRVLWRRDHRRQDPQRQRGARRNGSPRHRPASTRLWLTSDWPMTRRCDKCCTTTSPGRPRQRWPATTGPLTMCLTASPFRAGHGTDSRCRTLRRETYRTSTSSQPVGALQHFARLAAVRRTDDAVALHHIQDTRRPPVAQPQSAAAGLRSRPSPICRTSARRRRIADPGSSLRPRPRRPSPSSGGAIRKLWSYSGWSCPSRNPPRPGSPSPSTNAPC